MENLINLEVTSDYARVKRDSKHYERHFSTYSIDGLSTQNEYVPISSTKCNLGIYNKQIVHYSIPFKESLIQITSYAKLYKALSNRGMPFSFGTKSMDRLLKGAKGILFESLGREVKDILFLVAVKTSYMKKMHSDDVLDLSQFAFFVSKKFYTHSVYKSLFSKFQKEVLAPHIELGVEVIITNNIEDKCFKNGIKKPKFKTVTEMKDFLSSHNKEI